MIFDEIYRVIPDDAFIMVINHENEEQIEWGAKCRFPLLIWEKIWKWEVVKVYTFRDEIRIEVNE